MVDVRRFVLRLGADLFRSGTALVAQNALGSS
jgi:hypothetical protein